MKRFGWILLLVAMAPALLSAAPKKMTVAELQDVLTSLHNSQKTDEQIANELKQIELTEELTSGAMDRMVNLVDGPLSTEQIYVLEARSSMLAPPETDLPKADPPDADAQRALLARAHDYVANTYSQLPRFTAARLVARFQDGVETIDTNSGTRSKIIKESDPIFQQLRQYVPHLGIDVYVEGILVILDRIQVPRIHAILQKVFRQGPNGQSSNSCICLQSNFGIDPVLGLV